MTIKDCIDEAVRAGEMDPARATDARNLFDELEAQYLDELGPEGARIRANRETVEAIRKETTVRRRYTLMQMAAQQRVADALEVTQRRLGLEDKSPVVLGVVDSTGMRGLTFRGAAQEREVIRSALHQRFHEGLATFRRTLTGTTRNKALLVNVAREAFGQDTGDRAARELAEAWYDTAEFARKMYNAAGGHISKLQRWGFPQSHDSLKIAGASYRQWRDFIWDRLDRQRMIDGVTGRPFTDQKLELVLRDVHETLRQDGWNKVTPSGQARGTAIGNRRTDPRFLHFRSADDWLLYQERFGRADVFSTMLAHMDAMARDIGAMRALGPNPQATIRYLQDTLRKDAAELPGADRAARATRNRLERNAEQLQVVYDHYTGSANQPVDGRVARTLQGTRSFLTSVLLGSATITAITDVNFARIASRTSALPQARVLKRHLSLLTPGVSENQKLAVRLGLVAENWSRIASAQMRYVGEVAGPEIMQRMSDGWLRVSGLSPWTQAGRWAFGMEFMGLLADSAGKRFADLPAPLRRTMQNYQIDEASWDVIRATDIFEPENGGFLRPDDIRAREDLAPRQAEELATRTLSMILQETEFAVPSSSLRARATIGGGARPGTVPGELIRSGLMFKNFAITLWQTHLRRMVDQQGRWNKFAYGADLILTTTLMGAMAIQLKEISRGRDPREMFGDNMTKFWLAALVQGGGLGLFGDFAFSNTNRFGGSFGSTVAGPLVNFIEDGWGLTGGNLVEAAQGKKTNAANELIRFMGRYTPGFSLWYARLVLERWALDQAQLRIDPDARKRWRRQERKARRELGTRYFWKRGEGLPDRGPDIGNILGP